MRAPNMNPGRSVILRIVLSIRQESRETMPAKLQYEIDQLKGVSARLDSLAKQHPAMESQIMSISGTVLSSAVLLEVLLTIKTGPA
jgi:hypothetical protein